ncbi:MAG: AAA family ATPase [Solirubrobacterales bacterium]
MSRTIEQEALIDAGPAGGDPFEGEVTIDFFRFVSDDGTFAVCEATLEDGTAMPLVGALGHLTEEERALVRGTVEHHSRHGLQITVAEAQPLDPTGAEGARRYLRSLPGIGRKRAEELVAEHGENVFDVIDSDPYAVFNALRGVGPEAAERAADDWAERRMERRLYTLLAPYGLARYVTEVVALHGSGAAEMVLEDPYSLTQISGIGFHSADRLAVDHGVEPGSRSRTRAAAVHALREAENRGHTHLPKQEMLAVMRELLGTEPSLPHLDGDEAIVAEDGRFYREWTWRAERWLAATLAGMARSEPAWNKPPLDGETEGLTDQQAEAVTNALTRRLSVITGGPGTGKTHLTHALVLMAATRNLKIRLLAPTGRAARRLTEATEGAPASTIHKALEWIPGEIPGKDEDAPVEADLVIVDEASMLSLEICRHLVAAIAPKTHLVLIGDVDQLPPVGPGKPFCEVIESGLVPTVRLEHVFRQARRSMIVGAAHSIRVGEPPRREPLSGEGDEEVAEIHDFFRHSRSTAAALADDVVTIATERIPAEFGFDPARQVQILSPMYRGALGIDELHRRMRDVICGGSAERVLEGRFRVGEKVITTRGIPELEIANGTIFVVDSADDVRSQLRVETDLGDFVQIPYADCRALRGAFCTSVHKAQGIEVPAVIVCLHSSHAPQLLSRNLLYTAVTRAQKLCVLAGDDRAIARALRNTDATDRHSLLRERMLAD